MRSLNRTEAAAFLKEQDHFAILTHLRPDGDTLGSAAALCLGLRQLGKQAYIVENPEITEKYRFLHQGLTKPQAEDTDTLVCVDVAADNMLPACHRQLVPWLALRIDHHRSEEGFSQLQLVDPTAAACGDIIYDVLLLMGVTLDREIAQAIYIAISTDTGCFRYPNTNAHTLRTAAACYEANDQLALLNQTLFDTNSLGRLRLQGWLVEHAQFFHNGQVVICSLPRAVEEELGLTEDDLENISGFPRSIEGVKIAATLREGNDGKTKISVRAVPGYNAAAICQNFGGGGHAGAAGASLQMSLQDAAQEVLRAINKETQ